MKNRRSTAPELFAALVLGLASMASGAVHAQEEPPVEETPVEETSAEGVIVQAPARRNVLVADLSLGVISLGFERALSENIAVQAAFGLYGPWYETDNVIGFGGELRGFFFYPDERSRHRFYVAPGVRLARVQTQDSDPERSGLAYSARLSVGWSATWSWFVLRLGLGLQYHSANLDESATGESDDFDGVAPVADIYLGYAF